jgi:hypothetical protein
MRQTAMSLLYYITWILLLSPFIFITLFQDVILTIAKTGNGGRKDKRDSSFAKRGMPYGHLRKTLLI